MGHLLRSLAVVAVLVAGASPLAAFQGPVMGPTEPAKTAPAKPAKEKRAQPAKANKADKASTAKPTEAKTSTPSTPPDEKTAATTQRMLDTGIAAYEAGNEDEAMRAFDTAIRSGGLASQQMAKALYYRGLAYRKKGKPALAIPDLTSAIWLKDGLSATERQEAMSARAAAYREAGVGDAPQLAQPTGVAATSIGGEGWQAALDASTPVSAPATSTPPHTSAPVSAPQTVANEPARPPPPPKSSSSSSSSSGGGFFSSITNLFGGGSSASSNEEVTTSSIVPPAPAPETSAWSQKTEIATASPPPKAAAPAPAAAPTPAPVQQPVPQAAAPAPAKTASFVTRTKVAAVAPPVAPAPAPKSIEAPSGKFHVQVAAVRSRSEAYALSVRLLSQHGSELGPRRPQVEPTVMGSMGTFYRVKVGPYASAKESKRLCTSLRASGFDCLVIPE